MVQEGSRFMDCVPISFPTERERQRQLVEADRGLSFRERIQAIDGMLALLDCFHMSDEDRAKRVAMDLAEQAKKERCLHEFLRQQFTAEVRRRGTPD